MAAPDGLTISTLVFASLGCVQVVYNLGAISMMKSWQDWINYMTFQPFKEVELAFEALQRRTRKALKMSNPQLSTPLVTGGQIVAGSVDDAQRLVHFGMWLAMAFSAIAYILTWITVTFNGIAVLDGIHATQVTLAGFIMAHIAFMWNLPLRLFLSLMFKDVRARVGLETPGGSVSGRL